MEHKTLKSLEYDKIMGMVAKFAQSEKGKEALIHWQPVTQYEGCKLLLDQTIEADTLLYAHGVNPLLAVDNVEEEFALAAKGGILGMGDLLKIARVLRVSSQAAYSIGHSPAQAPLLKEMAAKLYIADELERKISIAILSETEMSDSASAKLGSLRNQIKRGNEKLREKLQSFITSKEYAPYLQDAIVTKRGDRYVIPVRNEYKSQIKGLVHDQSASGQTFFIEPLAVVELNNELRELEIEEQKEIERILADFSASIGMIATELTRNLRIVEAMDVIFARAIFGHSLNGIAPTLNKDHYIEIKEGRHPLIEKHKVVPVTMILGKDYDLLLVTGPNTGGKTVTLKLTGLFVLMGMSGLFVPADSANLGIFDKIYADIGDEQSIEQNLSTFSSHMRNVVHMVDNLDDNTLVLIDELGSGTDPEQGASLAVHITDYILHSGAKAVVTTHYSSLKEYSYATPRAENACMDFDPKTYAPLYRLIIGIPGTSNALEIAKRLGLKQEIVDAAAKGLDHDKVSFEEVLIGADQTRRKAEEEKKKYQALTAELQEEIRLSKLEQAKLKMQTEKLTQNARKEVKRLVDIALEDVNEIVDELKKMLDSPKQADYFEATRLRKKLQAIHVEDEEADDTPPVSDDEPQVGDKVYVDKFHDVATVSGVTKNGEYVIVKGSIKSIVKREEIKKLAIQREEKVKSQPRSVGKTLVQPKTTREIYLLGCTVDDALYKVSQFLDDAALAKVDEVKIIHGVGTGALRNAIWEYLNASSVVSFRMGKPNEGGQGVTFVRLK